MIQNKYYIKPKLLKWNVINIQEQYFKDVETSPIIYQILFLVLSLLLANYFPKTGLILFLIVGFLTFLYHRGVWDNAKRKVLEKQNDFNQKNNQIKKEAESMCDKLLLIRQKSAELVNKGIPSQLNSIDQTLKQIKFEFEENALIPFWDEVENFVKEMNSLEESFRILDRNKKTYFQAIMKTDNNLPTDFASLNEEGKVKYLIDEFKLIQREAFKKFEFANLWEQRKTQKIMAFGFSSLKDAINNMSNSVVSAITELNYNMQSGFGTLSADIRELEFNNYQDMTSTNALLESNLSSIDNKLYYIQYNRKPIEPFGDIFSQKR